MVRSFTGRDVAPEVVDRLLDRARRGPSAGFAQGLDFVVLEGVDTTRYWDLTLPSDERPGFPWPGLLAAPVLCIVAVDPQAYVVRYSEPDKRSRGLGGSPADWSVPYWHVDGGAAVMLLLLGAVDEGLGACFFGLFEHEQAVAEALGVPDGRRVIGTVALGHPAADRPSSSSTRARRPLTDVVHRRRW
jgi:nitroreductase